jgi:hypothetical protein
MLYVQGMRVSDLVFEDPECEGADLVLVPHAYAAEEAADTLVLESRQCMVSHGSGVAT